MMDSPWVMRAWMRCPMARFSSLKRSFGMSVGRLMNPLHEEGATRLLDELVGEADHADAREHHEEQVAHQAEQC